MNQDAKLDQRQQSAQNTEHHKGQCTPQPSTVQPGSEAQVREQPGSVSHSPEQPDSVSHSPKQPDSVSHSPKQPDAESQGSEPRNLHNPVHAPIPGLGLRSMKTALAAALTALLYAFWPDSNPTFACIGAIFGMGTDMEESRRSGGNRFFGTIIGGFIGLGLYWLEHLIYPEGCYWLRLPLVFLGIVVMISLCVLFRWPGGVQPGGVVLCIILFNTPAYHIDYAISRMIDTGIGVLIALLVNYLLPRNRLEHMFRLDRKRQKGK